MADIIQLRRDNASNWSAANPVLAQGELGFEIDGLKAKIGNGASSWNDLSYLVGFGASMVLSAGSNSTDKGTVYFSNANGITFGMNSTGVITASHNALTVQTGNFASTDHVHTIYPLNSLFAGTNISGTINATAFNLSVAAQTGNFLSTNASADYVLNSLFSGTNISGTVNSSAFNLSVAAPPTILGAHAGTQFSGTNISGTVNSTALQLSVAAPVVTTGLVVASTFTGTNISGTVNSAGWSLVGAVGTGFSGTNISGTVNGTGIALSVVASGNSTSFGSQSGTPSQTTGASSVLANNGGWVTVVTALGNYLSTNAASAYVLNSLFNGTNISGTVNSSAFNLSVAAPPTILGAHAGTQFSGTNISGTVNSTALQLSVAAPIASGNSTSFGSQSATPTQTSGASSVLWNNGAWNTVGGGAGIGGIGLSASSTNIATASSIYFSGSNLSVNLTTSTNGKHYMLIAREADIYNSGFALGGNTAGSTSYGNTNEKLMTFNATQGLYVSGTNDNILAYGVKAVSNVEDPDMWWNMATTYSTAISTASMFVRPFRIEWPVQFSIIDYPMSFNLATTNSSCNFSLAHTVALYSLNAGGTGLAPIVGNTGATVITFTSGNNAMSLNGPRIISQTLASTILTPGDYWFGVQHNWAITSGAQTSSHSWGPMLVSMPASTIFPAWSASSTATGTIAAQRPWQGAAPLIATSKGTDGTTAVITVANMVVGSTQGYRANIPIRLKNITY